MIYKDLAQTIWNNDPYIAQDRERFHSSGYHIKEGQLGIEDAIEDAYEALDIDPDECGISIPVGEWQKSYMDDPGMIGAMAQEMYRELSRFGRYSFDVEPDWERAARLYLERE